MDGNRFDDLSRALAQGRTRRGVLKGLAGGLAAGFAALTGREVAAQRLPNGSACTRATQCASLKCADGVCCNAQCAGQCEACDVAGSVGTCVPLPAGTQQHGSRPACTGTDVCQASCDGTTRNQCTLYPGLDISCAPGTCEDGFGIIYGCGGDGTCHPLTESCGLYVCDTAGVACLTTCSNDRDCVGEAFCQNGSCVEDRPLGEDCTSDAQCQSGICADGVCCVTACPGLCQACNLPGQEGFCTEVPDGGPCDGGTCCDGECVNTQTSLEHCGACDNACRLVPTPGTCEDDPICQAGTCTFTPLPAGTLCRESAGVCDVEERCNGTSIACPPDAFLGPNTVCRPGGTGPNAVCDPPEVCPGNSPLCPPNAFAPLNTACETGNLCTNDICDGQGVCVQGTPVVCPNPEQTCVGGTCVCPTGQPLDCGTFCGVECCVNNQCTPTELCDADGVCVPENIDLRRVGGGNMEVDDDLTIYVNGNVVFTESDGFITTYPPFNLSLNNGDQIRVVATNVQCCRAHIDPFELFRPSDGVTQVLDPVGFDETDFGAGLVLDVFYDMTFTVNLPPHT